MQRTKIVGLTAALILFASMNLLAAAAAETWSHDDAAHLLRRAGFGGTPEQIDKIHAMGRFAAVDYLLKTGPTTKPATSPVFPAVNLPAFEMDKLPDDKQAANQQRRVEIQKLRMWWLDRMCRTDR